jgi:hypothetical protein
MSDRPAGHLKCVGYQFRLYDGNPIEHYVFDDGSTWICRNGNSWSLDWNPDPIVTREPHCCDVEIHLRNETIRHYKDRIAELEAELKAEKAKFDVAESHAFEAIERAKKAEAELAALKVQPQEVPPLDPWRVLRTAMKFTYDKMVINERDLPLWEISHEIIAKLINRNSPTTVHPYDIK